MHMEKRYCTCTLAKNLHMHICLHMHSSFHTSVYMDRQNFHILCTAILYARDMHLHIFTVQMLIKSKAIVRPRGPLGPFCGVRLIGIRITKEKTAS